MSGPDAACGRMVRDAALLAIDEANRSGRRTALAASVADSGSRSARFLATLGRLAAEPGMTAVLGPCPSGLRAEVKGVLERSEAVLWDPGPNEGGLCSRYFVHGGPTPHQSLKHLMPWLVEEIGRRVLFIGSDEPHARELVRVGIAVLAAAGGAAVGKPELIPAGHTDFTAVLRRIRRERVEVVFSALTGVSAAAFLQSYRAAGFRHSELPVASPTLSEQVVAAAGAKAAAGAVAAQPYFAAWTSAENARFVNALRHRGARQQPTAMAEAAWFQIRLMAAALDRLEGSPLSPLVLREAAGDAAVAAPQGRVMLESDSLYTRLWPKIAVVEPSGRFKVLARSSEAIRPLPYWAQPGLACTATGAVGR
ncbi:MAG: transporter substrate-binding protein [Magnetospirillum sp.]|nr:transporter substrate-binding protein [Magnetospirillum sp.]